MLHTPGPAGLSWHMHYTIVLMNGTIYHYEPSPAGTVAAIELL